MSFVIRLENLPWSADSADIRQFFHGIEISDGGIHVVGGVKGIAFILLKYEHEARQAMLKDGLVLLENPIKLFFSDHMELEEVVGRVRVGFIAQPTEVIDDFHTRDEDYQSLERNIQRRSPDSLHMQLPDQEIQRRPPPFDHNLVSFTNRNAPTDYYDNYLPRQRMDVFHAEPSKGTFDYPADFRDVPQKFEQEMKYAESTELYERRHIDQSVLNSSRPNVPLQKGEFDSFSRYASRNESVSSNFSSGNMNKDFDSEFLGPRNSNRFTSIHGDFDHSPKPSTTDFYSSNLRNENLEFSDPSQDYKLNADMSFDSRHQRNLSNEFSKPLSLTEREKDFRRVGLQDSSISKHAEFGPHGNDFNSGAPYDFEPSLKGPPNYGLKLSGFGPNDTVKEIQQVLKNIYAPIKNIKWEKNDEGYNTGVLYVKVCNEEDYHAILHGPPLSVKTKFKINRIEVTKCPDEIYWKMFPPKYSDYEWETNDMVYMLKGLPYTTTENEVMNFFIDLKLVNVLVLYDVDKKATGTGFVEFDNLVDYRKAMERNGKKIGHRYIELLRSCHEDMENAKSSAISVRDSFKADQKYTFYESSVFLEPTTGVRPLCAILSGLPPNIHNSQIYEFFVDCQPYATHILLNASQDLTGRAYVEFFDPFDFDIALKQTGQIIDGCTILIKQVLFEEMIKVLKSYQTVHLYTIKTSVKDKSSYVPEKVPYLWEPPDESKELGPKSRRTKETFQSRTKADNVHARNAFNKYEDYSESRQVGHEQSVSRFDYSNRSRNEYSVDVNPVSKFENPDFKFKRTEEAFQSWTETDDISAKRAFNKYEDYSKNRQVRHEQNVPSFGYSNRSRNESSVDVNPVSKFEKPDFKFKRTEEAFQSWTETDDISAKRAFNKYEDYSESHQVRHEQKNIPRFDYSNRSRNVSYSVDVNPVKTEETFQSSAETDISAKRAFNKYKDYPERHPFKHEQNVQVFDYSNRSHNVSSVDVKPVSNFKNDPAVLSSDKNMEFTRNVDLDFNKNNKYSRSTDQKFDKNTRHPTTTNQNLKPNRPSSNSKANVESYIDPSKNNSSRLNTFSTASKISNENKISVEKSSSYGNKNTNNKQSQNQKFSSSKSVKETNFKGTEQKFEMKQPPMIKSSKVSAAFNKPEEKVEPQKTSPIKLGKQLIKKMPTESKKFNKVELKNSDEHGRLKPDKKPDELKSKESKAVATDIKHNPIELKNSDKKGHLLADKKPDNLKPRKVSPVRLGVKLVKEVPTKKKKMSPIPMDKKLVKEPTENRKPNKTEESSNKQGHVQSDKKTNDLKTIDSKMSNAMRDIKKEFISSDMVKPTFDKPKSNEYKRDDKTKGYNNSEGQKRSSHFDQSRGQFDRSRGRFDRSRSPNRMGVNSKDVKKHEIGSQNSFGKPGCIVEANNISADISHKELLIFFRGFELDDIIRKFTDTGVPTDNIRVAFRSREEAHKAIRILNYRPLRGIPIKMYRV